MSHTLTTHFSQRNFYAAFFAYNTAMLEPLVFTAQTFVVFYRAKNLGAKQTITFRLERTIVNRLRLLTSPNDQERINSGDAKPIRIESNSSFCPWDFNRLSKSFKAYPPRGLFYQAEAGNPAIYQRVQCLFSNRFRDRYRSPTSVFLLPIH